MKHRLVIGAVVLVGALCWLLARGPLTAADDALGLSLLDARVGLVMGVVLLLLAGLPAMLGGVVASSTGNPLTGAFAVSFSLLPLAALGGSIDGWLRRADLPGGYKSLAFEAGVWLVMLGVVFAVMDMLRMRASRNLKVLAVEQHLGEGTTMGLPDGKALLAGLVTAVGGAFVSNLLIRSSESGQVNCALILGFGVAGLIAYMSVPQRNPLVMLLSPMIVAVCAYLYIGSAYSTTDGLVEALYTHRVLNLGLALPIQYAASGVLGCTIGIGLAQTLIHVKQTTAITA